jgi:hypothetical protein
MTQSSGSQRRYSANEAPDDLPLRQPLFGSPDQVVAGWLGPAQPNDHDPCRRRRWLGGCHPGSGDGAPSCRRGRDREAPHRIEHAAWLRSRSGLSRRRPAAPRRSPGRPRIADPASGRLGGEPVQLGIHRGQLGFQGLVALTQHAQGQRGRRRHRQDRPGAQPCRRAGQPANGQARSCSRSSAGAVTTSTRKALAAWVRALTAVAWPPAPSGSSPPGGCRSWGSWWPGRPARPRRSLGIDRVRLAPPTADRTVWPVDSSTTRPGRREPGPGQPRAAGPLNPPGLDLTQTLGPGQQRPLADRRGRSLPDGTLAAQLVQAQATCSWPWVSTPTVTLLGSGVRW